VEKGLRVPPYVKTSLAPGSRVVTEYLREAGLLPYLERLGFHVVGYGCTTCIGNSGPLPAQVAAAIEAQSLVAASVSSGNRNFEGRINPLARANYLASPPLVVAYALAGRVDIDPYTEPIGTNEAGEAVYLRDIWPTQEQISGAIAAAIRPEMFARQYADVFDGGPLWKAISGGDAQVYDWNPDSTYIQEPPFFLDMPLQPAPIRAIAGARVLAVLGDSVTTDHISPAGPWLKFRGHLDRISDNMFTGAVNAFAEKPGTGVNQLTGESGEPIPAIARAYRARGLRWVAVGDENYGEGSSREHAAMSPRFLGVRAVVARSVARIHEANLARQGILPLTFSDPSDYERVHQGDRLALLDLATLTCAAPVRARVDGREGCFEILLRHSLDAEQIQWFRAGSAMNHSRVQRPPEGSPSHRPP